MRRLTLHKETLRTLTPPDLSKVAGGLPATAFSCIVVDCITWTTTVTLTNHITPDCPERGSNTNGSDCLTIMFQTTTSA